MQFIQDIDWSSATYLVLYLSPGVSSTWVSTESLFPVPRNSGIALNLTSSQKSGTQAQWLPVTLPTTPTPKYDVATQTVGLFYPSQKEMSAKNQEEEDKLAIEKQMRDRKPLMTAISPGRGW